MKKSVYLAGKIDGLTFTQAMAWRRDITGKLEQFDVNCPSYSSEENHPNLMWDKDYFLLDNSDIVLVNLDYENNSPFLGTSMEIGRAFYQRKPIIIFSSKDWVHKSLTLQYHATAIVNDIDEAIDIIQQFI